MRSGDWVVVVGTVGLVVGCGGKSVTRHEGSGAENGGSGGPGTSSGGTSTSSGGASIDPSGGTGAGGSAGMTSCAQPLDGFAPWCDGPTLLRQYCAKGGCHNASTRAAALDLTPDDLLVARILGVPATFSMIGGPAAPCVPEACPPFGTLLVDPISPGDGWILSKIRPFAPGQTTATLDMGCGNAMPTFNTTGISSYDEASKACLADFFFGIGLDGTSCALPGAGAQVPRPPTCDPL